MHPMVQVVGYDRGVAVTRGGAGACRADGTSPGACAQEASRKGPSVLAYISAAEYEQRLQAEQTRCPLNRGKLGNRLRNRVIA